MSAIDKLGRRSMLKLRQLLALLGVVSIIAPAVSLARCIEDGFSIDERATGDAVELFATNARNIPIAVTLRARPRRSSIELAETVTRTVLPNESQFFMVLNEKNKDRMSRYRFDCAWTIGSVDATHNEKTLYRLPYANGKSYYVLQGYGSRLSHTGPEEYTVDFKMREGTSVHAARGGTVAEVEESHSIGCWKAGCGKYANYIVILHDDWTTGEYYHLKQNGVLVEIGDRVVAGQKIGLSGDTGNSALPHLHFGVYRAAPWGKFQSVPVQFQSADGIIRKPRRGGRYQAASPRSSARRQTETDDAVGSLL